MKYQNRDFAMTSLGAKSFMRYAGGMGSASVGAFRPTTCVQGIEITIEDEWIKTGRLEALALPPWDLAFAPDQHTRT